MNIAAACVLMNAVHLSLGDIGCRHNLYKKKYLGTINLDMNKCFTLINLKRDDSYAFASNKCAELFNGRLFKFRSYYTTWPSRVAHAYYDTPSPMPPLRDGSWILNGELLSKDDLKKLSARQYGTSAPRTIPLKLDSARAAYMVGKGLLSTANFTIDHIASSHNLTPPICLKLKLEGVLYSPMHVTSCQRVDADLAICESTILENCIPIQNQEICVCVPGYTGKFCDIDVDDCKSNPCGNRRCIDGLRDYACDCGLGVLTKTCKGPLDVVFVDLQRMKNVRFVLLTFALPIAVAILLLYAGAVYRKRHGYLLFSKPLSEIIANVDLKDRVAVLWRWIAQLCRKSNNPSKYNNPNDRNS